MVAEWSVRFFIIYTYLGSGEDAQVPYQKSFLRTCCESASNSDVNMEPAVRCGLCSDVRVAELQYKCAQNTAARAMFIGRSSGVRPQGNQRRPLKKVSSVCIHIRVLLINRPGYFMIHQH